MGGHTEAQFYNPASPSMPDWHRCRALSALAGGDHRQVRPGVQRAATQDQTKDAQLLVTPA